jgi:hypothetical protein
VTNKQFRVIWYLSAAILLLGIVVGALIGITFIRWLAADLLVLIGGGVLWLLWEARGYPSEREKGAGTHADHFIYVNEDGTARDLTVDEKDYLNTRFHAADGARPYIKSRYRQLTPDRKISGYLLRSRLPPSVPVAAA